MRIVHEMIECDSCGVEITAGDWRSVRVRIEYQWRDADERDLCERCIGRVVAVLDNPRAGLTLEAVEFEAPLRVEGRPPREHAP